MRSKMATILSDSKICRLCSVDFDNGIAIFDAENSSSSLELIINRYLPLKVVDDGKLPRSICYTCNEAVTEVSKFFDIMTTGQKRLRELLKEQVELLKKQKRLANLKESFDEDLDSSFALLSEGNPLFDSNHAISLALEGRLVPRRKPGRPRKLKPNDSVGETIDSKSNDEIPEDIVDPEHALELMFKEAEEKRQSTGDVSQTRRRRRIPQRFEGVVQGKELDAILQKEVGPEEEEDLEAQATEDHIEEEQLDEDIEGDESDEDEAEENGVSSVGVRYQRKKSSVAGTKVRVGRPKKRRFICEYCGKSFLHSGHFSHHIRTRHCKSQFMCLSCNEMYSSKEELVAHQQETQHTGEGMFDVHNVEPESNPNDDANKVEFKCCACDEVFPQQTSLTSHIIANHVSSSSSVCDLCGKSFSHPSSVIYHKEVSHSKGRAYVCTVCNKGFKHKQLLQRHSLVHSDERRFMCQRCGLTFKTRANLYNHNAVHSDEKRYSCTYCDAKFSHKTSLVLHTRWHTGEKPFRCSFCDKSFSQAGNLQEHERIHTGEKPFDCKVCSKRFTTSSQHRLHMKRHNGDRPWKCEYCDKDFLHKDSWKCHMRRHRGERPYSCSSCSSSFTEQWALKKHMRLHTGEKPYECPICNKAFSDLSNLQKHKKTHKNVTLTQTSQVSQSIDNLPDVAEEQHLFYLTTENGDPHQLLISTIDPNQSNLIANDNIQLINDEDLDALNQEPQLNDKMLVESADGSDNLTIAGDSSADQVSHAVEFTTQDGRSVCFFIPSNVDGFEYLSNLS